MNLRRPSALMIVTAALLVLVPTLAALQYRWVGQVSEAERQRMQTSVRNSARQFRDTLDGEIARAAINLQVGASTARDGSSDRYSDRYEAWSTTAAHPQIVANVFLLDAEGESGGRVRLRRWNTSNHVFELTDWPPVLQPWRTHLERELSVLGATGSLTNRPQTPEIHESLVLVPLRPAAVLERSGRHNSGREVVFGFTVLQLDLDYIRTQLLPELAQRYFLVSEDDGYRVVVRSTGQMPSLIYQSHPGATIDPERADAVEPLFGIRGDAFFFGRGFNGRGGNRRTVMGNMPRGERNGDRRQAELERAFDRESGRWVLLAQHQVGSLDAAVRLARNHNLTVGFGILLLLSLSVAVLALSSQRAQRLARQQMEFVASVSHELRTPVAVIQSAAENLSHGVVGNPERVKRYGDTIGAEARRLGEMVENVMQYAGLESGRGLATPIPLVATDVVAEALREAAPTINAAGAHVERHTASDLPPVAGDASALRSAVQNLIVNAVKYGGADRWVGVHVTHRPGRAFGSVRITVEDHGEGVPASELPHIFEPFYRGADASSRQVHGNGLGLSIVKRIVAAHGGEVSVVTTPGGGSAFTIALPAIDPTVLHAAETEGSPLAEPGAEARP